MQFLNVRKIFVGFGGILMSIFFGLLSANATDLKPYIDEGNQVCLHKGGATGIEFCQVLPGTGRCLDIPLLGTEEPDIRTAFQLKYGDLPDTLNSRLEEFSKLGIEIKIRYICATDNNNRW